MLGCSVKQILRILKSSVKIKTTAKLHAKLRTYVHSIEKFSDAVVFRYYNGHRAFSWHIDRNPLPNYAVRLDSSQCLNDAVVYGLRGWFWRQMVSLGQWSLGSFCLSAEQTKTSSFFTVISTRGVRTPYVYMQNGPKPSCPFLAGRPDPMIRRPIPAKSAIRYAHT